MRLEISLACLFDDVVARAPGERHDGERGILVGVRGQGRAGADDGDVVFVLRFRGFDVGHFEK